MEDKEKYKDIKSLTAELATQVKALESGKLAAGELESMAEKARELYERIIVIRHLAFERIVKDEADQSIAEEPREMPFRINMNRPPISKNQTSLIDVIEELTAGEESDLIEEEETPEVESDTAEVEEEPNEPEQEEPSGEDEKIEAEESVEEEEPSELEDEVDEQEEKEQEEVEPGEASTESEEEVADEEQEIPEVKIEPESESEPMPIEEQIEEQAAQAIDGTSEQPETLADRLKMTPLEDLKKAIGLNQKFQFINELFEGDADEYAESIDRLNSAEDMESAIQLFENELAAKNDWEEDHPSVLDLRELVQRRHL